MAEIVKIAHPLSIDTSPLLQSNKQTLFIAKGIQLQLHQNSLNIKGDNMTFLRCLSLLVLAPASLAFQNCPYLGPDFTKPTNLQSSPTPQLAFENLTSSLAQIVRTGNSSYGQLNGSANSFSIEVFSAQEPTALFQSHHTATDLPSLNSSGVTTVNSNTVYRIGSLTKLLSVYTFLIQAGDVHFHQPITKYVPELAAVSANMSSSVINNVMWADVTIGELASQMAGIGRDSEFSSSLTRLASSHKRRRLIVPYRLAAWRFRAFIGF